MTALKILAAMLAGGAVGGLLGAFSAEEDDFGIGIAIGLFAGGAVGGLLGAVIGAVVFT